MPEGSVEVDQGGVPTISDDNQDTQDESLEESQEVESEDEVEDQTQDTQQEESSDEEGVEYTEKGTKLDTNPQSAAYQQLANERRVRQQYEQVLNNPDMLKKYAKEMGLSLSEAKEDIQEKKIEFSADKFKTAEDVAQAFNEISSSFDARAKQYESTINELRQQLTGLSQGTRADRVLNTLSRDIEAVRGKYPELNPKSPTYDAGLEREIGEFYYSLDFDPQTNSYRGEHSFADITDRMMRAAGKARQKGSQDAQTQVKTKKAGKVVTSKKPTSREGSEPSDPSSTIASRISKLYK